ncbi:hypothetical protein [Brevundimonas sp.]|uniref:class I SAM-dependent methyltransferase n=1 Tax=Brevundimonas sp. TaxID=1871086 RepID=UPI0025CF6E1C|nr:hypothetical protein [Brevundimonas sp.]
MLDKTKPPILDDAFEGQSIYRLDGSLAANGKWDAQALFDVLTPEPDYWRGKRVMDVGANTLGLSLLIARAGASIIALEPDPRDRLAERQKIALDMAKKERLNIDLQQAEFFDAKQFGAVDEVLFLGVLYHFRYFQFTLDFLSTLDTKTVVVATQTHPGDSIALFNRKDPDVWPMKRSRPLLGWHATRPALRQSLRAAGFTDLQSLTNSTINFPKKPKGLTNSAYYRATKGEEVDPFKVYRDFY